MPIRSHDDAYCEIVAQAQRMTLSCDEDLVQCVRLVGRIRSALNRNEVAEALSASTALAILAREIDKRLGVADASRRAAYAVLKPEGAK